MIKVLVFFLVIVLVLAGLGVYVATNRLQNSPISSLEPKKAIKPNSSNKNNERTEVITTNLEVVWGIAFLPDGTMLFTERSGRVRMIDTNGNLQTRPIAQINVVQRSESGLHGIAIHPEFESNKFVYLYYTYGSNTNQVLNRVSRYVFENNTLQNEKVIVDAIPGAPNHDGGRIKFGPDNYLYIATGDAQEPSLSQNTNSLAGKILRVTDDGQPPPGNPFNNLVYTYGHRNPQGLAWDEQGQLWETEHGSSATDEFNKLESGANYGWPEIRGDETRSGMKSPILQSGSDTWAPAGMAYHNGSLFFTGLRGQALYEVKNANSNPELVTHFKEEFGRIREVVVGPDNMLYIGTSNRDGRGPLFPEDDKIIRVNPSKL